MKVMLLANETPEDFALRDDKEKVGAYMGEWFAFSDALKDKGFYDSGAALEQPATATVISVRDGVRKVEDGPFPDTKEQLGGFCLIDAPSLQEASEWAEKCPAAKLGYVDVRAVPYLDQGDSQ